MAVDSYARQLAKASLAKSSQPSGGVTQEELEQGLATKVDKLTSTEGLKAYTRNGSSDGSLDITSNATANTLITRDENGNAKIADPVVDSDISNKKYVDSQCTFIISLTEKTEENGQYTADKTYTEIKQAYEAKRPIMVAIGEARLPLMNVEINETAAGFSFGYTQVQYGGEYVYTRIVHYLHTNTAPEADVWSDNDRAGYYIQLEAVKNSLGEIVDYEVASNINMGEKSIENIQRLHINGQASIYIGQVVETGDANRPRLTGIVNSNAAAFVKSGSQADYVPLFIGAPTANDHATTKKYVDDKLNDKLTKYSETSTSNMVYGVGTAGEQSLYPLTTSILGNAIPLREATGILKTATPVENDDVANKGYVDGLFNYDETTKTLTISVV